MRKRKKRRSSITLKDDSGRPDLLAIGTSSGSLLVYSLVKGDLHTQLVSVGLICCQQTKMKYGLLRNEKATIINKYFLQYDLVAIKLFIKLMLTINFVKGVTVYDIILSISLYINLS